MTEPSFDIESRIRAYLDERLGARKPGNPAAIVARLIKNSAAHSRRQAHRVATRCKESLSRRAAILCPKRPPLEQELGDHLRDAYDLRIAEGHEPEEAWRRVTNQFGDCEEIYAELRRIHAVTLWEWITRGMALLVTLALLNLFDLVHTSVLLQATSALSVLLAPILAAWFPVDSGTKKRSRWITQAAALAVFAFSFRMEGFDLSRIALAGVGLIAVVMLLPSFRVPSFFNRLRAYILLASFVSAAMGLAFVVEHAAVPSQLGAGVAVVFISVLYGVLFAKPKQLDVGLLTAFCQMALLIVTLALLKKDPETSKQVLLDPESISLVFWCIGAGLLAGWSFWGRRPYTAWLPAAGTVAMILFYIHVLSNLGRTETYLGNILIGFVPLGLWLLPLAGSAVHTLKHSVQSRS